MDSDKNTTEDKQPEKLSDLAATDDAPLKIEGIKKPGSDIPETNLKAPLKIEEVGEKEEDGQQEKSNEQALSPQEQGNKNLFIFGGIVVGIIILATVGFFIFSSKQPQEQKTITPQSETSTPKPTEAPKKALNRADWSMEVLNGSGVSGAAKKIADKLKDLGYPIVKVGNADKDDYETSQILVSKTLQDKIDLVLADIKDIVKIASSSGDLKDSTASARIILGKE